MKPGSHRLHAPGKCSLAGRPHPPAPKSALRPPDGRRVGSSWQLAPGACPLLLLAVGSAPLAAQQGLDGDVQVPPGRPTATGGHLPTRVNDGDPRYGKPVPCFRDPPESGAGAGRTIATHHSY